MPFKSLGLIKSSNAFGKALYALHLSNEKKLCIKWNSELDSYY